MELYNVRRNFFYSYGILYMYIHLLIWSWNVIDASCYLLVLPGRLHHGETATYHHGGQHLSVAAAKYVCTIIDSKLNLPRTSYTCARQLKSHFRVDPPLLTSHKLSRKFKVINARRGVRGLCQCRLSSAYTDGNLFPARKFGNHSFLDGQNPMSKYSTVARTTADFTSEEYDITGTNLDSILSPDGASEAVLVTEVGEVVPWWKQLPKRWVMVLLCFTAFLLCNMDRVRFFMYYTFC